MPRGRPSRDTIYAQLDALLDDLQHRLGGLPTFTESKYVWQDIWHLEAHHSTALEGNTLVLREVETLLDHNQPVGGKPLREYMEVRGYGDAAQWVYGLGLDGDAADERPLISMHEIREIHHLLMTPVWSVDPHPDATPEEAPGSFRQHELYPFDGGMQPPSWPLVSPMLEDWVRFVNEGYTGDNNVSEPKGFIEWCAQLHYRFERIHPFIDGNGRTGRLVLNLVLLRLGYPPIVVLKRQRPRYLNALQAADAGDFGALGEIVARAMIDNLNRFILPSIAGRAKFVPLAALVDRDTTIVALRTAARKGRLEAYQTPAGVWMSTRAAVDKYLKTRHQGVAKG